MIYAAVTGSKEHVPREMCTTQPRIWTFNAIRRSPIGQIKDGKIDAGRTDSNEDVNDRRMDYLKDNEEVVCLRFNPTGFVMKSDK
ncbi:hypothetical protein GCM10009000_011370 [Halobacterium noricense]|uniref:Uncharacterized protein n=1 Tax=Haladaptatus pallidirubidus TaxID=1008152 RepID=A0AAV3UCA8_9EURY